jgi:hypothetical protein
MNFIDDVLLKINNMSADDIIESIAQKIYSEPIERKELASYPQFIQDIIFFIDFDTELSINGILGFLENSTGEYIDETIVALKHISADSDADILQEIRGLIDPRRLRMDLSDSNIQLFGITSFSEAHNIPDDAISETLNLSDKLYLYDDDRDLWPLLEKYVEQAKNKL